MLSATTTQSPLATQSSVFTIPSVSMGSAGISLTDHLFLPGVSALDPTHGASEPKAEQNGMIVFMQKLLVPPINSCDDASSLFIEFAFDLILNNPFL